MQAYPKTGEVDTTAPVVTWSPWGTTMAEIGEFQRIADNTYQPTTINKLDKTKRNRRLAPLPQPGVTSSMDYGTGTPGPWRDRYSLRKSRVDDIFAQEGRKVICKEWSLKKTSTGQTVYLPSWKEENKQLPLKSSLKNADSGLRGVPLQSPAAMPVATSQPVATAVPNAVPVEALHLPDINSMDVQFLTNNNEVIGLSNDAPGKPYSFPRGINNVPIPDIKDVNVSFGMPNGQRLNLRATPQPPK